MPIILPYGPGEEPALPMVIINCGTAIQADGETAPGLGVSIANGSGLSAALSGTMAGAVVIAGGTTLEPDGRVNDDANKLGAVLIEGATELEAAGRMRFRAKTVIGSGPTEIAADARVIRADSAQLRVVLSILDPPNAGFGDVISARISADGVNYPIRSAQYSEGRNDAGVSLQCTLQKPSDRAAILAASTFKFEIYTGGAWNEIFDLGRRTAVGFSQAFVEARPNDALSVTTSGPIGDQLNASPEVNLTVYDPLRETLSAESFKVIRDTEGLLYVHDLEPIAGMRLYDLLDFILVDKCGFDSFETDLPNFPIRTANFEMTSSYLAGLSPHLGAFSPLIFVRENVVWILDSTQGPPPGFGDPIALGPDDYRNAQLNEVELNADGYLVKFADNETQFDYDTTREVIDEVETLGTFGAADYQEIHRERTFRDYYKLDQPFTPVRVDKIEEIETLHAMTSGVLTQILEMRETLTYDPFARIKSIVKEARGDVPSAVLGFPTTEFLIYRERTEFLYMPDRFDFRRKILSKVTKLTDGLIAVDSENEHLGEPFRQAYYDGLRAGNLAEGIELTFGPIESAVETYTQTPKGQYECRTRTVNFLTNPPAVINPATDARAGDMSLSGLSSAAQEVIVLRDGFSRTTARMLGLSVGELPVVFAVPLARRRLERQTTRSGNTELVGLKLSWGRGVYFELFDRDELTVGNYIIEGRNISLSQLGTANQQTSQTLEITQK